jgi:hypothetical protein
MFLTQTVPAAMRVRSLKYNYFWIVNLHSRSVSRFLHVNMFSKNNFSTFFAKMEITIRNVEHLKLTAVMFVCTLPLEMASGHLQRRDARPFVSAGPKNASGVTSSSATHRDRAIRGDANPVHICVWNASRWTLRERVKCPLAFSSGPPSSELVSRASLPQPSLPRSVLLRLRRSLLHQCRGCLFCARTGRQRLGFYGAFNGIVSRARPALKVHRHRSSIAHTSTRTTTAATPWERRRTTSRHPTAWGG